MISSEAAYRQYGSWSSHLDRRIVTTIADNTFNRRRARAKDGLGVTFSLGSFPGLGGLRYADNLGGSTGLRGRTPATGGGRIASAATGFRSPDPNQMVPVQTRDARQPIWGSERSEITTSDSEDFRSEHRTEAGH